MTSTHPHSLRPALTVLCVSIAWLTGCGESAMFSLSAGHIDEGSVVPNACFEGADVELFRYSTRCERASVKSLSARVDGGLELAADVVETLDAPCAEGPTPAIEVRIEDHSLVFDFSEVTSPGRFPSADFDGYVIDLVLHAPGALLVAASVDSGQTTLPVGTADIYHEPDHLEVNFQNIAFDERGFVKIDLLFASVSHQSHGAE